MRLVTPGGRHLGYKPDLPDHRDLVMGALPGTYTPPSVDMRIAMPAMRDQGELNTCAANAAMDAAICAATWYTPPPVGDDFNPSRLFAYWCSRYIDGGDIIDEGTTLRSMMKAVASFGIADEETWPYDTNLVNTKPSQRAFDEAKKERVTIYQRVPPTEAGMKSAIAGGYPVVFGLTLYKSFETHQTEATGEIPVPSLAESAIGGHAMLAVGYDDSVYRVIVKNSWGIRWGKLGYCLIPYQYVFNPGLARDGWVIKNLSL